MGQRGQFPCRAGRHGDVAGGGRLGGSTVAAARLASSAVGVVVVVVVFAAAAACSVHLDHFVDFLEIMKFL